MRTTDSIIYPTYGSPEVTSITQLLNTNNLVSVVNNLIMHLGLTDEQVVSLMDNPPSGFDEYWQSEYGEIDETKEWPTVAQLNEWQKRVY